MADITITQHNATSLRVKAEPHILMELKAFFSYLVPGYKFMPKYKSGHWDGRIYLFKPVSGGLYVGLYHRLRQWAEQHQYTIDDQVELANVEPPETFPYSLSAHGSPIEARDYQIEGVKHGIRYERAILQSPTGSGKSLILYLLTRHYIDQGKQILLIVPTKSLVNQMYSDFEDYASGDSWSVADHCAKIMGGMSKDLSKPCMISTWQSLQKLEQPYFDPIDVVFVDECHGATGASLTGILERCVNAHVRIGTTGTLADAKANEMVLTGLLGPPFKVITTKALMDNSSLADLNITCLVLTYPKDTAKLIMSENKKQNKKRFTYQQEKDWLIANPVRNRFLKNLALSRKGNTLLLYQYVEGHGQVLYNLIAEEAEEGRKVFFVHGKVDADDREAIRGITEKETNAIIIASQGTMSTGTNIRNLHNVIFASPSKSKILVLQSIGRGLRKSESKGACEVFDIGDDLRYKKKENHTYLHFVERLKIFSSEEFTYKIVPITMTDE